MPAAIPSLSYHHHMDSFDLLKLQQQSNAPTTGCLFQLFSTYLCLLHLYWPPTYLTHQVGYSPTWLTWPTKPMSFPPTWFSHVTNPENLPEPTDNLIEPKLCQQCRQHCSTVLTELTVQTKQTITGSTSRLTMQTIQTMQTIEIIKTTQTTTHTDFKSLSLPSLIGQLRNSCDVLE